jgi:UDP-glucose 4-epimerase
MIQPESLFAQKVLVTGASGFLGTHLCRHLSKSGAEVFGVSRRSAQPHSLCAHWFRADMANLDSVKEVFEVTRPQVLYHLAGHGFGSPDLENVLPTLRDDLITTVNILTVAQQQGVRRLILAASLEEPQPGASDPLPSSPYAAAKWASGAYARMFHRLYGTPIVILRPMMTYGPGQRTHKLIPYVTLALLQGQVPKLSSGSRPVDWVYIDDVIEGMATAAVTPGIEGCTIDLGSGVLIPIRDAVLQLARVIGNGISPEFGTVPERPMEKIRVADTGFAYQKLGWTPRTPLQDGFEQTVEWYRKELVCSAAHCAPKEKSW